MDQRRLPAAGAAMEEVTAPIREATFAVPVLGVHKLLSILENHLLQALIKDDRVEGTFRARTSSAPIIVGSGLEYFNTSGE